MNKDTVYTIKKTSSGLGFMLFIASVSMYTLSLILVLVLQNILDNAMLLLANIVVSIVSLFVVGMFYCWISKTNPADVINVRWVKLSTAVPLILVGLTVAYIADYLTELIQSSFGMFGVENAVDMTTKSPTLFESILNIVSVCVIPALVEEFLFRGIVLGKLRAFGDSFAMFMTSMAFALMHGNIVQIPFAFIVGLSLAFITIKTDSLLPAVIIHFIVNFRSVIVSVITDNNILTEDTLNLIYILLSFALIALGIASAAILSRRRNFFKFEQKPDIPFRGALRASILSVGMIFFIINCVLTTIQTVSLSSLFGGG